MVENKQRDSVFVGLKTTHQGLFLLFFFLAIRNVSCHSMASKRDASLLGMWKACNKIYTYKADLPVTKLAQNVNAEWVKNIIMPFAWYEFSMYRQFQRCFLLITTHVGSLNKESRVRAVIDQLLLRSEVAAPTRKEFLRSFLIRSWARFNWRPTTWPRIHRRLVNV